LNSVSQCFFPPRATDRFPIPVRLAGENATLQQLADRLSEALKDAGYEGDGPRSSFKPP
jgi:hypothetical protein